MTLYDIAAPVLAAEAGGAAPRPTSGLTMLIQLGPILLIFAGFIFFSMRSQKRRDRERREMLDNIRPKDDVVTIGGIRGRVVRITDDEVVLRIDPEKDVKITIARTGISRKVGDESSEQ
jgi:preprotein translocase subunit YajC